MLRTFAMLADAADLMITGILGEFRSIFITSKPWLKAYIRAVREITKSSSTFFSATNFSNYILELLQLHDEIKIEWNYAWIHCNIAIRSHLMI